MKRDEMADMVRKAAGRGRDGRPRLACAKAFALSRRLLVPARKIGEICDAENIKIERCQLGCFR